MSDKIAVVYIGPKPKKKLSISGNRLVFMGQEPVHLHSEIAYQLLEFDEVFAKEADAAKRLKKVQETEQERLERLQQEEDRKKKEELEDSWLVIVDGEERDISKLTTPKLRTIIEAEELVISREHADVQDLRALVRAALRAKQADVSVNTDEE